MTDTELNEQLKKIVAPYVQADANLDNLKPETNFINDLGINSANLVDIVLDIEDEFDITIENQDMEQMTSVQPTIDVIKQKLNQ